MATNKALIKEATELAKGLDITISTDGLKNAGLVNLVSDLKAKKKDAETHTQADGSTEDSDSIVPQDDDITDDNVLEVTPELVPLQSDDVLVDLADSDNDDVRAAAKLEIEERALESEKVAKTEAKAKAAAKAKSEAKAALPEFEIAGGKSITTKRGILAEGDEIKAEDLHGGQEAIDSFVGSGHINKN